MLQYSPNGFCSIDHSIGLVTPHEESLRLDGNPVERCEVYRQLFTSFIDGDIRRAVDKFHLPRMALT